MNPRLILSCCNLVKSFNLISLCSSLARFCSRYNLIVFYFNHPLNRRSDGKYFFFFNLRGKNDSIIRFCIKFVP